MRWIKADDIDNELGAGCLVSFLRIFLCIILLGTVICWTIAFIIG